MYRELLEKALDHAEQESHEGEEARVLNKLAELSQLSGLAHDSPHISNQRDRAEHLKSTLEGRFAITQHDYASKADQYDKLVCVLYR